jgi:protein-L-isoaspartate(D-aspartate) O-methyltransferase
MISKDVHDFAARAERMVRLQLEARGISDSRVLEAMTRVPRDRFVPSGQKANAYEDFPVSIGHGQTISQPYMVAFMVEALGLTGREKVLEVGTGSGYQAAVLSQCASQVFTIERVPELLAAAQRRLAELGYANVKAVLGDGGAGLPEKAPFDRIIVSAAAPSVPQVLQMQLADNGVMVVPVGDYRFSQVLMILRRTADRFETRQSIGCRFVPLIGEGGFEE